MDIMSRHFHSLLSSSIRQLNIPLTNDSNNINAGLNSGDVDVASSMNVSNNLSISKAAPALSETDKTRSIEVNNHMNDDKSIENSTDAPTTNQVNKSNEVIMDQPNEKSDESESAPDLNSVLMKNSQTVTKVTTESDSAIVGAFSNLEDQLYDQVYTSSEYQSKLKSLKVSNSWVDFHKLYIKKLTEDAVYVKIKHKKRTKFQLRDHFDTYTKKKKSKK